MRSAVEMMIRIPVVMTGEIESWPCEELMYCSRANVWQEWGFCSAVLRHGTPLLWFRATIDSKRQSTVERGVSGERARARFVYTIRDPGFSTNWLCPCQWGREKGGEKGTWAREREEENSAALAHVWIPARHPSHVHAKWRWFLPRVVVCFFFSHPFVSTPSFLAFPVFWCFTPGWHRS